MKFLTWLLGVMVILLGVQVRGSAPSGWTAVWMSAAVLWFFAGVVMGGISLAKLVAGKVGAGALSGLSSRRPPAPAPHKEE